MKDQQEDKRKADKKAEKKKDEERRRKVLRDKAGWAVTQGRREDVKHRVKVERNALESERRAEQDELRDKDEAAKAKLAKEAVAREKRRFQADLDERERLQGKQGVLAEKARREEK